MARKKKKFEDKILEIYPELDEDSDAFDTLDSELRSHMSFNRMRRLAKDLGIKQAGTLGDKVKVFHEAKDLLG